MNTSKFLFLGGLTILGVAFAAPGCGDDDSGTGGAGTTSSTTSTTSTTSSGGDGGKGGGGSEAPTCEAYCAAISANCVEANLQYKDEAGCVAYCKYFDVGTAADTSGNTLGCRAYHATAAAMDPATHCIHAGPTGADVCGSPIDSFCSVATQLCDGIYATVDECKAEAETFTNDVDYSATVNSGDSFACRQYHLTVAATDAATHCQHIKAMSDTCQ